jgi:hypothetical protein
VEGKVLENRRLSREGGLGGTVGAPSKTDCFVGEGGYLIGLSD